MQCSRYSWKIFWVFFCGIGFHYYSKYWQPQLDHELYCQHELYNAFDFFAIKICIKTGVTVGHLPMKISRATKFLLDRGGTAFIKLYSTDIVFPLVQGGLEIPCRVEIQMPPPLKNRGIIDLYKSKIDLSYDSRERLCGWIVPFDKRRDREYFCSM